MYIYVALYCRWMFWFKIFYVIAINRNLSVQRKNWSDAIRADLRCWYSVEVALRLTEVELTTPVCVVRTVSSWFSCRGAEQLMGYLLVGWRRCVWMSARSSATLLWSLCVSGAPQAWCRSIWDLTCSSWVELWFVPGTARRHFIAELTTYIVVVGRGLPSIYTQRYVEYGCL